MNESITYTVELTYTIKGYENYSFGKDKHLYNTRTGRRLKQCYKSGSIGYWLGKKFFSLKKLKTMLYKVKKQKLPF